MEIFKFLLLLFTMETNFIWIELCEIELRKDMSERTSPFLLHNDWEKGFLYNEFESGKYKLKPGSKFNLACSSEKDTEYDTVFSFRCENDNKFIDPETNKAVNLNDIHCEKNIKSVIKITDLPCKPPKQGKKPVGVKGTIGFEVKIDDKTKINLDKSISIIDFCHDKTIGHTIYAHSIIPKQIGSKVVVVSDKFTKDGLFGALKMDDIYNRNSQFNRFNEIFGSADLAAKFISVPDKKDNKKDGKKKDKNEKGKAPSYLAKGHLVAKTDFIYGAQQRATFSYVNVIPMWQCINQGNWYAIEQGVREYAIVKKRDLHVWTGSIGVLQMKNGKANSKEIYLHSDKGKNSIPVPKLLFKVVYDKDDEAGVAFITINNPYLDSHGANYVLCQDFCGELKWLKNFIPTNYERGYTHCCKISDFRNLFPELPQLPEVPDSKIPNLLKTLDTPTRKRKRPQ